MLSDMDMYERNLFMLYCPFDNVEVLSQKSVGDCDTIFVLSYGERILFDTLSKGMKRLQHHEDNEELTDDEWHREFRRKLRKKITLSRLSQKELSDILGVSENTVSNYVNGKSYPNVQVLRKMCKTFKCTTDELTNFDYLL